MICAPTIDVITAAIASFTPIAASGAVFCLSDSSCTSAFFVISGATMLIVELSACASAMDYLLTSLFLMATLYLKLVSMFGVLLPSPTMQSADSLNNCCSRTRLICLISVTAAFYSSPPTSFLVIDSYCICAFTRACASDQTRNNAPPSDMVI